VGSALSTASSTAARDTTARDRPEGEEEEGEEGEGEEEEGEEEEGEEEEGEEEEGGYIIARKGRYCYCGFARGSMNTVVLYFIVFFILLFFGEARKFNFTIPHSFIHSAALLTIIYGKLGIHKYASSCRDY
jgi:hypothetical protein